MIRSEKLAEQFIEMSEAIQRVRELHHTSEGEGRPELPLTLYNDRQSVRVAEFWRNIT
jgi:hypothetical protein